MATTFTIPLTTLPVGTLELGPSTAADAETSIGLTIDRTVTGGLNSLTSATSVDIQVAQSNVGGTTWQPLVETIWQGGLQPAKGGGNLASDTMFTQLNPGTSRKLRAQVTVSGSSVAVAGSLVTQ